MAKYLYSELKIDDYKSLHHTKKLSILREIIIDRLFFKNEYLSVCSRILFYILACEDISLLTIQKKKYLENNMLFDKSASLRDLRARLGYLKKQHLKVGKRSQNKKHKKEGKKGVYVLLDTDYQKKLEIALKCNKMTLTALFTNFIDSMQPTTKA